MRRRLCWARLTCELYQDHRCPRGERDRSEISCSVLVKSWLALAVAVGLWVADGGDCVGAL